jgi:hypothetical protein
MGKASVKGVLNGTLSLAYNGGGGARPEWLWVEAITVDPVFAFRYSDEGVLSTLRLSSEGHWLGQSSHGSQLLTIRLHL